LLVDHGASGGPRGFWSVAGIKFTTAPLVARHVLDRALPGSRRCGGPVAPPRPCRLLAPADVEVLRESSPGVARAVIRELVEEESVVTLDDLVLRRLDWSWERAEARSGHLLEGLVGGAPLRTELDVLPRRPGKHPGSQRPRCDPPGSGGMAGPVAEAHLSTDRSARPESRSRAMFPRARP
jgi:hypothetical protein